MLIVCSPLSVSEGNDTLTKCKKVPVLGQEEGVDVSTIPAEDSWNFEKQCEITASCQSRQTSYVLYLFETS